MLKIDGIFRTVYFCDSFHFVKFGPLESSYVELGQILFIPFNKVYLVFFV